MQTKSKHYLKKISSKLVEKGDTAVVELLKGVNLYLVGMMGVGKTTVGQILAKELGYRFVDTDTLVEAVAKKSINDIFAQEGEETFRELESKVLAEVAAYKNLIIATGGGVVLKPLNWSYLHHGVVVWLDVPAPQLYQRLAQDTTRPLLQNPDPLGKLQRLLEARQPLYSQADVRVICQGNETPQQVAQQVIEGICAILKPEPSTQADHN